MKAFRLLQNIIFLSFFFLCNQSLADEYRVIDWDDLFQKNQSHLLQENITQKSLNEYLNKRNQSAPNSALSGQKITITGFVVPLEYDEDSNIIELLLVPYYGACIHVPPPPRNQIIHVYFEKPFSNLKTMDMITISGLLTLDSQSSLYGESDYKLIAEQIVNDQTIDHIGVIQSVLLILICGFTICLGWFIGKLVQAKNIKAMGILLSFSAGTMLYLSLANLWLQFNIISVGLLLSGFITLWILSLILERKERLTSIALILHNVPEIFIIFSTALMNIWLGFLLTLLVSIHNIALGFSLSQALANQLNQRTFTQILIVSFFPVLIVLLVYWFIRSYISMELLIHFSLFSGGMLFYIALKEMLPLAKNYINYQLLILSLVGSFLMMLALTQIL